MPNRTTTVNQGESLMDVCMRAMGSIRAYTALVAINGLAFGASVAVGQLITLPEGSFPAENIARPRRGPTVQPVKLYTVLPQQTLADVCLQVYGSMEYYAKLITDNGIAFGQAISAGITLKYNTALNSASEHVKYYNRKGRVVVTGEQRIAGDFSDLDFSSEYLLPYIVS